MLSSLLLLLLLLGQCAQSARIACASREDYHALLYRICTHSLVCSRVYYLDHFSPNLSASTVAVANSAHEDYRKFVRQLARFDLHQQLVGALPEQWLPPALDAMPADGALTATGGAAALCAHTTDLASESSTVFVLAALQAMETFALFVRQENYCADRNERLYLMSDGSLHCLCMAGYSCANEATYETILEVLLILSLVALTLWTASIFWGTFTMTGRLHAAMQKLNVVV
jgi:hypothetical protein